MYLDASVVIDIMKLENNIRMNKEKRELARINRDRMRSLNYSLTMLVVAVGEVIRFIKEINDDRKRKSCVEWFWKFLEENNIDVLPIVRDVVFIDDDNCVFKIAKDIIRGECSNPNDWWGGRTLDGNDALILAQAILDDEVSAILTTDSRMLQATTIHDMSFNPETQPRKVEVWANTMFKAIKLKHEILCKEDSEDKLVNELLEIFKEGENEGSITA